MIIIIIIIIIIIMCSIILILLYLYYQHIIYFFIHCVFNVKWPDKACTLILKYLLHLIILSIL